MVRYLVARLIGIIPTLLLLVAAVVVLVRIVPGSVIDAAVADQGALSKADRAAIEKELGLQRPIWEQYLSYLGELKDGSLGQSLWTHKPVTGLIGDRFLATMELSLMALVLVLIVAIPAGVLAAIKANSIVDYVVRLVAVTGLSAPSFIVATYVLLLPTIWWGWYVPQYAPRSEGLTAHLLSLLVPAGILAFELAAPLTRVTRTCVLEVLRQDYTRTARAKGMRERVVLLRHVLRNSLIPVVSVLGIQIAALFSGVVIIEQIFGVPGVGQLLISAFTTRDYTLVQGITLTLGALVLLVNIAVDLTYPVLDPRVRL